MDSNYDKVLKYTGNKSYKITKYHLILSQQVKKNPKAKTLTSDMDIEEQYFQTQLMESKASQLF